MKIKYNILACFLLLPALTLVSCLRDDIGECPPLRVHLTVKDKNYFNVDKVELEQRRSEDLPFREYVPTLYYVLRDFNTGEVVEEQEMQQIDSDAETLTLDFCPCLPHGKYLLTVWGGMRSLDNLAEDALSFSLHPANTESDDIYMTNDIIEYDPWHNDFTAEMERTKGKLIIEKIMTDYPGEIGSSVRTVSGIFGTVDNEFNYSAPTFAAAQHIWDNDRTVVTKTLLSPSSGRNSATLRLDFFAKAKEAEKIDSPEDLKITMERNMITAVRYVWNKQSGDYDVYILVNDNWEQVHGMEID